MTLLFDENISHRVVAALKALGHPVEHVLQILPQGATDETIFREAGERGWCLVTQDKNIKRKKVQREAMKQAGAGVFVFTGRARRSVDELTIVLLERMPEILELAARTKPPFMFGIPDRGEVARLD